MEETGSKAETASPTASGASARTSTFRDHPPRGTLVLSRNMLGSLAHRDFRLLWVGNLLAMLAMQMQNVVRGWLIVDMTGSAVALTWVLVAFMGPFLVFSLMGGVMADRLRKKWVMIIVQIWNVVATTTLGVIVITGNATMVYFIVFGIVNGTLLAFSMPARQAIIPQIVGERELFNAMALNTASMNMARILGPALAGLIAGGVAAASEIGAGIVFFVIAGCYLVAVLTLAILRTEGVSLLTEKGSVLADMRDALSYIRASRLLTALLAMAFIPIVFGMPVQLLLPVFNEDIFTGEVRTLGWLFGVMGAGALLGSLVLAAMGDVGKKGLLLLGSCLVWAVVMAGFALSSQLWLAMILIALVGASSTAYMAMNWTLTQLVVKPEMRGRVMSMVMMSFGMMPLGVIPMAFLAETIGIDYALALGAGCLGVLTLLVVVVVPSLRRIDKGHEFVAESGDPAPA